MLAQSVNAYFQSAYKARHSTETALVRALNDMLHSTDERRFTILGIKGFCTLMSSHIYFRQRSGKQTISFCKVCVGVYVEEGGGGGGGRGFTFT